MFAQGGEHFAERQVEALLASLRIDGAPAERGFASRASSAWADDFLGPPAEQAWRQPGGGWAQEYSGGGGAPGAAEAWAHSFAQQHPPPGASAWGVDEFLEQRAQSGAAQGAAGAAAEAGPQTLALVQALSANGEPTFQNSKFLQFVSKMSRGELVFEGNAVRERPGAAWAEEFSQPPRGREWGAELELSPPAAWADEFSAPGGPGAAEQWAQSFSSFLRDPQGEAVLQSAWGDALGQGEYAMRADNPYSSHPSPLQEGIRLFRSGVLSEAALALEAAAAREPGSAQAWRLLGTVHAENDDDGRAIAAMARALQAEPRDAEVLLSLGVSHTNELDAQQAVGYVAAWLAQSGHAPALPPGAQLADVLADVREAALRSPRDADLQTVLGVLHSLQRDYDAALAAFSAALALKPEDYSLWNKLGATRANSARSGEAIEAYRRALELKPNYVRAWCNMGIAYANQGAYPQSVAYYLRALSLNPASDSIWGYARISLQCCGREDLLRHHDERNLDALLAAGFQL